MKQQVLIDGDSSELHVVEDPNWTFSMGALSDTVSAIFEIINMWEATGDEEYEDFPWYVNVALVPSNPKNPDRFDIDTELYDLEDKNDDSFRLRMLEELYQGYGGVPITEILVDDTKGGKESGENGAEALRKLFEGNDKVQVGTYQSHLYKVDRLGLQFVDVETAKIYMQHLIDNRLGILGMIGFILDRPVNRMGTTGWALLKDMSGFEEIQKDKRQAYQDKLQSV